MPQLPRSESASAGSGFSWKPSMRPSESWITTPYSRVSCTFFTVSVAIPPALWWRSTRPLRSVSVRASPETITTGSSPKKSATLRTPPAVPSSSSSKRYSSRSPK